MLAISAEEPVIHVRCADAVLQVATANPDGRARALLVGGGIANFTDVAATFSGIIRALKEKVYTLGRNQIAFSKHTTSHCPDVICGKQGLTAFDFSLVLVVVVKF